MIWVEILSRHREVATRFRCAGEVRIGRGYDNDVIVDDPYVAARHMRVFRDETGRIVAEDLGSANGILLHPDKSRHQRIVIDGDRPIQIGHTYLRIRETSHAVEHERVARRDAGILPIALVTALSVLILGTEALALWFSETAEPKASRYLTPLLGIALTVTVWVAVWALLSRVLSGRARFQRNLLIALCGGVMFTFYYELAKFSAFALTWHIAFDYQYVAMWTILATVCFFHLREVGSSRLLLKGGLVVLLFALVITVQTLRQHELFHNSGQRGTLRHLMPPALRLVPVHDEKVFFAEIERLKTKIDDDRTQARADDHGG